MVFVIFVPLISSNCESTLDVPASNYDLKKEARRFETLHDLSVARNLFSKAEMSQLGKAGTDGLSPKIRIFFRNSHEQIRKVLAGNIHC